MQYDLLLVNLCRNFSAQAPHFKECIGQHLIAAFVAQHGFESKVYGGDILQAPDVITQEIEINHVPMIGFYVGVDNVVMVGNFIAWLKQKYPQIITVVGGPEAFALDAVFLDRTHCDYIVVAEGELPILELLAYHLDGVGDLSEIQNLRYLDLQGNYQVNPLQLPIQNLDILPFADAKYSLYTGFRTGNSMGILTGRGCPFHCAFCFEGATSKTVRLRSVENVMAEIDAVREYNSNLTHINIYDDTFTLDKNRVAAFCRELKARGFSWTCEAHVATLYKNPEMLPMMTDAGLVAVQLGIESGCAEVLQAYQKKITPEMIIAVVEQCKQTGVHTVEGNYIIGGAFESEQTLEESMQHAKKLIQVGHGIIELSTVYLAPFIQTPIQKRPEQFGLQILPDRLMHSTISMLDATLETEQLSAQQIVQGKRKFEAFLKQCYREEAHKCTKSDVLATFDKNLIFRVSNSKWYEAWKEIPRFNMFMQHLTPEEQTYAHDKYPIRTGFDYIQDGADLLLGNIRLTGKTAQAWLFADGKRTVQELAVVLDTPLVDLQKIYTELNERCMMYFSKY